MIDLARRWLMTLQREPFADKPHYQELGSILHWVIATHKQLPWSARWSVFWTGYLPNNLATETEASPATEQGQGHDD